MKLSPTMELSQPSDESKVLMIYTGGTIGMLVGQQGYVPEPYFLTETLRSQHRFHDPLEESLFSHSASVEGFREWSSSGKTTPEGSRDPSPGPRSHTRTPPVATLPVRSSRPIGPPSMLSSSRDQRLFSDVTCTKISEDIYEANLPSLVTPRTNFTTKNTAAYSMP